MDGPDSLGFDFILMDPFLAINHRQQYRLGVNQGRLTVQQRTESTTEDTEIDVRGLTASSEAWPNLKSATGSSARDTRWRQGGKEGAQVPLPADAKAVPVRELLERILSCVCFDDGMAHEQASIMTASQQNDTSLIRSLQCPNHADHLCRNGTAFNSEGN